MNLVEFPEQTTVIARNQPPYKPMPAWVDHESQDGRVICVWEFTFKERLQVLLRGKLWHHILTFGQPVQPQALQATSPFSVRRS